MIKRFKKSLIFLKKLDYRHYICVAITIAFMSCFFFFPNCIGRLIESLWDICTSTAYYIFDLLNIENNITPTVLELSRYPFPQLFPLTWNEFVALWDRYWQIFSTDKNFLLYLYNVLYVLALVLELAFSLIGISLILYAVFKHYFKSKSKRSSNVDSKPLRLHKQIVSHTYYPVKIWFKSFIEFIRKNSIYLKIWICIWALYFNLITIAVELVAFYWYFATTFNVSALYTYVYKLFADLSTPIAFIPLWAWIIIGLVTFYIVCRNSAYNRLNRFERRNRGFLNARPICLMICATMGKGKTTMMTDMGLSQEVMLRDKAFELILENDLKFPYFPWINLENAMRRAIERHEVYSLATTRLFISKLRYMHERAEFGAESNFRKRVLEKFLQKNYNFGFLFDYDYKTYGYTYDNKLEVVTVWDVIEIYAQLYFIYLIKSSMLANYSVRMDMILKDTENFPLWNMDFFKRDTRLSEAFSRHAKILDFDALRLGQKIVSDNKYADFFEFGTILITEIGKERGNKIELSHKKKDDKETNQKNDLFTSWLKMIRHSATVDGYPFVKVIMDDQRPESLGADCRELCEIVHIREKGEKRLTLPFFFFFELFYALTFGKFVKLYYKYRHARSDNTLIMHLYKLISAKVHRIYKHVYNVFGFHVLETEVERGTQDGSLIDGKYYVMSKKVYSKRFSTDCFSDYFTMKSLRSSVGLNDLFEYKEIKASFGELAMQNSYFVNDLLEGMRI